MMETTRSITNIDGSLLNRLAQGDEEAFNTLYLRYGPVVFNVALLYVKDADTARDVVKRVFVNIWEKRAAAKAIESFRDHIVITSRTLIYYEFLRSMRQGAL